MFRSSMTQLTVLVLLSLVAHVQSQCVTVLMPGCRVGSVGNTPTACCSNLICVSGLCFPCVPAGSFSPCNPGQCCAGATCINSRCVLTSATPQPPNDPIQGTPSPTACAALLSGTCQANAPANSPSRCCDGGICLGPGAAALCYPCLRSGSQCFPSSRCCEGLACSSGTCQSTGTAQTTPAPPNDPTTPTPQDPTNCRAISYQGCDDNIVGLQCCSDAHCNLARSCQPCIQSGNTTTCVVNDQGSRRCCRGLVCVSGRCQAVGPQDPTPAVTMSMQGVTTAAPTPAPTTVRPPLDPTNCRAISYQGCDDNIVGLQCCADAHCNLARSCQPCIQAGNTTTCVVNDQGSRRCCRGLVCVSGQCQAVGPQDPTPAATVSIQGVTTANQTPTPAPTVTPPQDPTNCRAIGYQGCDDNTVGLQCCSDAFCNLARSCQRCIGAGNTTACLTNAQGDRRCCSGLACVNGLCQNPCGQFGAPCSASQPCCPGGLRCNTLTNTCDFAVVGRLKAP